MGVGMLREQASGLTRDQRNVRRCVVIVPVLVTVIVLSALGSEDHSARFGRADDEEAREPFSTDRVRREGAPAPERLRR